MKVLVVEDEKSLSDSICQYLHTAEYLCDTAFEYNEANQKIHLNEYVCIVLDLTLPNGDGLKLLEQLKDLGKSEGVLIVSARNSLDDKIEGLLSGADDYLPKPFHMAELGARVNAIIRRKSFNGNKLIQLGSLSLDLSRKSLMKGQQEILLTRKEYDLLLYLVSNKNKVVTKQAIVEHLWGEDIGESDSFDFIYAHIKNLRKKLAGAGSPDLITVVYGMGYKLRLG